MKSNNTKVQRGLAKRIKYAVSPAVFRVLRPMFNAAASVLPYRIKYGIGTWMRRRKYPYCTIRPGDVVIQVGAPRDLLRAGRSRAVHFARMVAGGRVVIIEPDPENCRALEVFLRETGLGSSTVLVSKGVWSKPGELDFLSSPDHPAANVLVEAKQIDPSLIDERHYSVIKVPVATMDSVIADMNLERIRLVSLTTNGAEPQIIEGMTNLLKRGIDFISLASTNEGYPELMERIGYRMVAIDDRGYTFQKIADGEHRSR